MALPQEGLSLGPLSQLEEGGTQGRAGLATAPMLLRQGQICRGDTSYYFTGELDGYSRFPFHWELRESMKEEDVEIVLQRALEQFPGSRPRIISDNGPVYIARDFKTFIREAGMTHVRTSPYCPQSNGKIERFHHTIKHDAIRRFEPSDPDQVREVRAQFVGQVEADLNPLDSLTERSPSRLGAGTISPPWRIAMLEWGVLSAVGPS